MPTMTCPHWCARDHQGDTFYHASETASVQVSGHGRLDVQAAQYLPDDSSESAWSPSVEITVHAGERYRLIGLTPAQARDLARMRTRAAGLLDRTP
jgi:hypothetical protein